MKIKRIICLIIVLVFSFSAVANAYVVVGLENFEKTNTYNASLFSDVSKSSWYYNNVASAYEYGLMNGSGNHKFNPSGNITIAEAITVASRIHNVYYGGSGDFSEVAEGDQWYDVYVRYAKNVGITNKTYPNYNAPATRAQFAEILSKSVDPVDLEEINWVDDNAIPDVKMSDSFANAVYMLYRAGILAGSDSKGTFKPQSSITRAEASAIFTRIIVPSLRVSVELGGEY